ncbi:MAG: 4Fe-4S binding protein [Caldilineaceae bacterium]|jgi:formate hydrogenlyase subunit 6/NADH:ubiquinone oxidoreductase subunit I|nr:4Fe-4S binding protein [Caldilineaceae bacterium]
MNLLKLAPILEQFASTQPGGLRVESARCLHSWNQASACDQCVAACPSQALTVAPGAVSLDAAACSGCGLCLHLCPTGVFAGEDETAHLLRSVATLRARTALDLTCGPFAATLAEPGVDAIVQVQGCLASLGAAAYVGLTALGVDAIGLRLEACDACPIGALRKTIAATAARAATLTHISITVRDTAPAAGVRKPLHATHAPHYSRRALLHRFVGGNREADLPLPPLDSAPPVGKTPPLERRALLHALAHLPKERRSNTAYFPSLAASSACTACQTCAAVCPTGALSSELTEHTFALHLDPLACTACGLCVELCAPAALQSAPAVAYADAQLITLLEQAIRSCKRCHASFAGEGDLCPACAFRRKHPAGMMSRSRLATPQP